MSYQYVNVEIIRKVAVIEFNYSRKLNALSKVFIDDLMQALSDLNRPEIRCVILRAPGGAKVFSMTPVNLGVPYNLVGIHNLTRDAGFHIVKELIFTALPITAQRALAVGILNHVVDADELEDFTLQMAHHISEKAPLAIAVIKEELRVLGEAHTMNSDEFERIQGMRRAVYDSEDYQEGMSAFMEKRKPEFVGH